MTWAVILNKDYGVPLGKIVRLFRERFGLSVTCGGLVHAIRRAGLKCPEDVSVVGFDDFQIASSVWPPLTTVRTPTREIGRMAAEKLIGLSDDTDDEDAHPREAASTTSPALVVRDSTGPAPR